MKIAIYTCITGGYDLLRPPHRFEPELDYLCFTDRIVELQAPWQPCLVRRRGLDAPATNRWVKMLPHRQAELAPYGASLYVDGSIEIVGDLQPLLDRCLARPEPVQVFQHPFRDCLYDEALFCARMGHDSVLKIGRQTRAMRMAGFPAHHGLFEAGVLFRRHGPDVERMMEAWWEAYIGGACRDQLSLPFVAWREAVPIGSLGPSDPRFGQRHFKLHPHRAARVPLRVSAWSRINRALLAVAGHGPLFGG